MEYQALYRKYRPQRFDEVVGQEHVTETLSREIVEGRMAHAYLFAGPRGTGKTTTARLLAKALNCPNRKPDGEPCNECDSCRAITEGISLDVIELDAASHNKVEDVREIRVNVGTVAAAAGAHRVYILDEAHMLSRAAGNALLKTLEEPPEHVIFVLATTEPYKLLDTIRSRSQRFDFHPVSSEHLVAHLADIAGREAIDADEPALSMVASHAGGSVRDAMSLLEQVAALGDGEIRPAVVTRALGLADREAFSTLADAIVAGDAAAALALVAELASRGADLRRFIAEAVEFFRGIFLAQYAPNLEEVVDDPAEIIAEWRRHAETIAAADVLRAVDMLGEALLQLRQGREERLVIELTLLRLARPETATDPGALASRLDRLEGQMRTVERRGGGAPPSGSSTAVAETPRSAAGFVRPAPPQRAAAEEASSASDDGEPAVTSEVAKVPGAGSRALLESLDLATFETIWPALVARVRNEAGPVRHTLVKAATPVSVSGGLVRLALPPEQPFYLERLRTDKELTATMTELAAELLDGRIEIEFTVAEEEAPARAHSVEPDRAPDQDELLEEGIEAVDPTKIVFDVLGGEIVTE